MSSKYRGFDKESNKGNNYSSGAWGSGDLDAAALAKKYGLDTSNEGRGDNHIWGTNPDGSEVYIGKSNMGMATNADLISAHSRQAHADEVNHSAVPDNLSSLGDIKGAILNQWSGGPAVKEAEAVQQMPQEIVLSERAAEAVAGTKAYENVFLPRQGDYMIGGDESVLSDFEDEFQLNLAKARAPQPEVPQILSNAENGTDVKASNFAENFKLAVKDTLRSNSNY
jgi:hypothetical protein